MAERTDFLTNVRSYRKFMPMTTEEAGRRGGLAVKKTYGPEFYSGIGEKGGERVKEKHGPSFYSEIGKKGGRTRARKQMELDF